MTEGMKAPIMWRKPRSKVYDYNQEFGDNYYKPMIDYLNGKEIQGCFFEKPTERIHLPDPMEVICNMHNRTEEKSDQVSGVSNLDHFLVKAYSKQIKEQNTSTAKTRLKMLNNITSFKSLPHTLTDNQQTPFDSIRLLKGSAPGKKLAGYYCHELGVMKNNKLITEAKYDNHLLDVNCGRYDYHHNVLDMGGILPDEKFYDPEKVDDIVSRIRFKKADRVIPVLT